MEIEIKFSIEDTLDDEKIQKTVVDILHRLSNKIQDNEIYLGSYQGAYLEDSEGNEVGFIRIL